MITRRAFSSALLPGLMSLGSQIPQRRDDTPHIWDPDRMAWQPDDPPGAKYALLDGDRDRPGALFSYAFWLPGGVWAPAHYHSEDAHVCVVRGTLKLGFGSRLDKSRAVDVPSGHFFIARAGERHFEGSNGECLIIGTALGPWKTTVVE